MRYRADVAGDTLEVEVVRREGNEWHLRVDGADLVLDVADGHLLQEGRSLRYHVVEDEQGLPSRVVLDHGDFDVTVRRAGRGNARGPASRRAGHRTGDQPGRVVAPMNGQVVKILHQPDETVAKGDVVMMLEAMKMENEVLSPLSGRIAALFVRPGSTVRPGDPLFSVQSP